jgi:hypothetical protein
MRRRFAETVGIVVLFAFYATGWATFRYLAYRTSVVGAVISGLVFATLMLLAGMLLLFWRRRCARRG